MTDRAPRLRRPRGIDRSSTRSLVMSEMALFFCTALEREELDHLLERHELAVPAGLQPSSARKLRIRGGQDPQVLVVADRRRPVPLRELLPSGPWIMGT